MTTALAAAYVHVIYRTRGQMTHDEVLCQRHFAEAETKGVFHAPESRGQSIIVEPWAGEPHCTECDR